MFNNRITTGEALLCKETWQRLSFSVNFLALCISYFPAGRGREHSKNCVWFSAHQNRRLIKAALLSQECWLATSVNELSMLLAIPKKVFYLPVQVLVQTNWNRFWVNEFIWWCKKWFAEVQIGIWMTFTLHFVIKSKSSDVREEDFFVYV